MADEDRKAAWKAAPPFPIATSQKWKIACALARHAPNPKAAALVYARFGVPVIPCNPVETGENSKRPYVSIYEGSIDPAQIEQWWAKYPDALIGCPMGRRTGVFVLDVDSLEGHGVDGIKNWQLLELEFQPAVFTRTHWSASKGIHLLFRWDECRPIGTSLGNLPKGMEVKGEGGQIILPGSVLRNGLRWTVSKDDPPAPAPDWLLDILSPHTAAPSRPQTGNGSWRPDYAMERLEQSEDGLRSAGDHERNAAAGQFAMPIGHMAGGGGFEGALTIDQVRNRLIEAARANPGRSAKFINDVGRAFDNGLKEPARPRGRASKPPPERTITLSMAEVEMRPIEWLWPDRVAIGKLTMLAGHPANGKSLVTLDMAARISTGNSWPLNGSHAPLGNVILLSAEDDPADTYGPRLKAMGADLSRIFAITMIEIDDPEGRRNRRFDLQRDIDKLEETALKVQASLISIDPVSAYMGSPGKIDTHRNTDVRAMLAPLAAMAERIRVAVVLVSHLTKSGPAEALQRVTGSGAFIAAARGGFMVERDESNGAAPGRRLMLPIKTNLSAEGNLGLAYRIGTRDLEKLGTQPVIEWEHLPVDMSADQALAAKDRRRRQPDNPVINFLREFLSPGPRQAKGASEAALAQGYSSKQLRTARETIGVAVYREQPTGPWWWKLPDGNDVPF